MSVESKNVVFSRTPHSSGKTWVQVLDAVTGEVIAGYWDVTQGKLPGRPPKRNDAEFMKVYRTNWVDICGNKRLTFTEAGVLMHLLSFIGWETTFLVDPKTGQNLSESDIAERLSCDRSTLHDALIVLNNKGFISIVKRGKGHPSHFQFNPHVAFFGKYTRDLKEHEVFDGMEYQPVVRIKYREPEPKS